MKIEHHIPSISYNCHSHNDDKFGSFQNRYYIRSVILDSNNKNDHTLLDCFDQTVSAASASISTFSTNTPQIKRHRIDCLPSMCDVSSDTYDISSKPSSTIVPDNHEELGSKRSNSWKFKKIEGIDLVTQELNCKFKIIKDKLCLIQR